jgi:copper chaperone NosL
MTVRAESVARGVLAAFAALGTSCGPSVPLPATLDTAHEQCRQCRMVISDQRFASQVVAPYEEPWFFDDLGCLTRYLRDAKNLPREAIIFVADHRTRVWVRADQAVFTRVETLSAPMGSHIVAHASASSRDADVDAAHGTAMEMRDVFEGVQLPGSVQ